MISRHTYNDCGEIPSSYCTKKENDSNCDKRTGAGGKPEDRESLEERPSWEAPEEMGSISICHCHWGTAIPALLKREMEHTYSPMVDVPEGRAKLREEGASERALDV